MTRHLRLYLQNQLGSPDMAFSIRKLGKIIATAATLYAANKDEVDAVLDFAKKKIKGRKKDDVTAFSGTNPPPKPPVP